MALTSININSSVSVYVQIENLVQFAIASGEMKAGDQLPSVKKLGATLGVNFNTVAKAYRDLEIMGLIHTVRGVGCYVKKGVEAKCYETCRRRNVLRLHEVIQEARAAGLTKKLLSEVINKSYASDSAPYASVPKSVIALAQQKK